MSGYIDRLFGINHVLKKTPPLGDVPTARSLLDNTLRMAWPSMLESFLFALVSFIDTLMVSTLGDDAIDAVGLTGQPRLIFFAVFFALQPAISALVARRRGEGDRASAVKILKLSLVVTLALTAILSVAGVLLAGDVMRLAGSREATHNDATTYFQIILGGMVFNSLTITINAAQRGSGNTKISMRTNIVSNVVNVILNYLLIGGNLGFPRLGVAGAAIATVIGQFCGFLMALSSVLHPESFVSLRFKTGGIFERQSAKSLFSIGSATFAEQIILRIGFLLYAFIIARLVPPSFTTHQIAMQFLTISFAFGDGLSVAAVALVGYALGQKRSDLAKLYGAICQRIGLLCSAVLSVVYIVFGRTLFSLFSDNEIVIRDGTVIMWIMCLIVLIQISQVIFSGCLRGAGDSRYIALVSLLGIGILRPLLAWFLCIYLNFGVIGAWAGLLIDQTVRLAMTTIRFFRGKWTEIKI